MSGADIQQVKCVAVGDGAVGKFLSCLHVFLKFIYSEKATKFCEISTVDLSYVATVKSTVEILQNSVAFTEYMNFNVEKAYLHHHSFQTQ